MNPEQLLKSMYLGDRYCKGIVVDSVRNRFAIEVNVISRLKPGSETWDYYTDADIVDGSLVFTGVSNFRFEPAGPLPNGFINRVQVENVDSKVEPHRYRFELSIDSIDESGKSTEVILLIEALGLHLEDPAKPDPIPNGHLPHP